MVDTDNERGGEKKMKKIAILGCENSHANSFIKFIQQMDEFSDVEIVGVYSNDPAASEKLNAEFGVPVLNNYADAVGKIDGLIVTARHGDLHYEYAKPYIESGIPMFIDKPVTIKEEEALELAHALRDKEIKVTGGSSLRHDSWISELHYDAISERGGKTLGGIVRAPYSPDSEYGGFYFYAQHLVEMVCEIFGRYPISVESTQNGGQLTVRFHYADYDAIGVFCASNYKYYALRFSTDESRGAEMASSSDWFLREFREYYGILSGGDMTMTYKDFIAPVFIMNAIERSLRSGKEEPVREICL